MRSRRPNEEPAKHHAAKNHFDNFHFVPGERIKFTEMPDDWEFGWEAYSSKDVCFKTKYPLS
jgi:hypothetical protein